SGRARLTCCVSTRRGKPKPDPQVFPIIEESKRQVNIIPGGKPISITNKEIVEMILFLVVNEACRVIEEGVVVQASVLGMSFPSYRLESLKKWSEKYSTFYKPSRFLEERARNGVPLCSIIDIGKFKSSYVGDDGDTLLLCEIRIVSVMEISLSNISGG
nr:peroxisomal fatty acid beta-oxidation multifunctional protein AIM1-like [Tanacetum cinerariifolium]